MEHFQVIPSKLASKSHEDAHENTNFTNLVWSASRKIMDIVCYFVLSEILLVLFLLSSDHRNL